LHKSSTAVALLWQDKAVLFCRLRQQMCRKITGLSIQKKNPQRVNVFLDGEFGFGVSRIVAAWLQVGQELSDDKIQQLKGEDEKEAAYQQALRLLNNRYRSTAEIRKSLEKKEYPVEVIEGTLSRLADSGLVNDDHFARMWVDNRTEFRPRSKWALSVELRQRGLSQEIIDKSIEGVDDEELAYRAGMKHVKKLDASDWLIYRKQMCNFLIRRGFNYEIARNTTRRIWEEICQEDF
jgi:regulatory protein